MSPPDYSGLPYEVITEVNENDIVCGRKGLALKHSGNMSYRKIVALNKEGYATCLKNEKLRISKSIVAAMREVGGRFLERLDGGTSMTIDEKDEDGNPAAYRDIGDRRAVEKTSQALREGQPKIRRMLAEKQGKMAAAATTQASSSVAASLPSQAPHSLAAAARYQEPATAASMAASSMSHAASARPFADFSTESLIRAALANSLSNSLSYSQYNPLFAPPPPPQPQERLPVQQQERAQEERPTEEEGVGSNEEGSRSNKERRHSQVTPPPQAQAPPQAPQASLPAMPNYMQSLDADLLLIALLRRANGR